MIPVSICGWYSSTYAEGLGVADFQPQILNVCNDKLYAVFHSACLGKGVYISSFKTSWSSPLKISDTHGSETNFYCNGDTFYIVYYSWGDQTIFLGVSYDGGVTWNIDTFADSPVYGEDEPYITRIMDTLYITWVYEIEGSRIRLTKIYPSGSDTSVLDFPLPFALHNGPLRFIDTIRFISATGWNGNGIFLIRIHPSGYDISEIIDTSYYSSDIEVNGDTVFILGSGPGFIKFCYSTDLGITFNCSDIATPTGIVSNQELVITPYGKFAIWSDSLSRYSIKILFSSDNVSWILYDSISSSGNEKFPVSVWHNGLHMIWTSTRRGKPEVYYRSWHLNSNESDICLDIPIYYDVLGRRTDRIHKGVYFEVKCGKVSRVILNR